MGLTDEARLVLQPILPTLPRRPPGRGRPWRAVREVLNGVRWIVRTGAPWQDLPARYPPTRPVPAGSNPGPALARSNGSSRPGPLTSRHAGRCIAPRASSTALSWWPNKGASGGKDHAGHGSELMAPHWANRKKPTTPDGRALRRGTRRWTVERLLG
jgi:hypothetical protein